MLGRPGIYAGAIKVFGTCTQRDKTLQGMDPDLVNNHFKVDIRNKQREWKEWKKGLIKENYVLEVRKCGHKGKGARRKAKVDLAKEIKTNSKMFFRHT